MKRIYFLPQSYLENKMSGNLKAMKVCILAVIILDLIFLDILISRVNKLKLLDNNIKQKVISEKDKYLKSSKEKNESNKTLDTFYVFIKNIGDSASFEKIDVENKDIDIEINSESVDYINFIKDIETKDDFAVKKLDPPSTEDSKNFKVNLELK